MSKELYGKAYIFRLGSYTNIIGRPPRFFSPKDLSGLGLQFASVYEVTAETAVAIEEAGTAAGFKGVVWSQKLWIDLDTEEAAKEAQQKLKELGYDHAVYTTGNRGCHIGIARPAKPSHCLPQQDKAWVRTNIPGADLSLYWQLHLIRLPGAIHEQTGKRKELLYHHPGTELLLPPLDDTNTAVASEASYPNSSRPSIFTNWEITSRITEGDGSRHSQLVHLACALRRAQVTRDECLWVVAEANRGFNEPKPFEEMERIVQWAYNE